MSEKYRFHVVSLPHRQTIASESTCAYVQKTRKWADMMTARGHTVYLYAGEHNDAAVEEHVVCITDQEQAELIGGPPTPLVPFDPSHPAWVLMNNRASAAISERAEPRDFLNLIAGPCQQSIAQAVPHLTAVEFGIGYAGTFTDFRVFESYAWMHCVYGDQQGRGGGAQACDGRFYDRVIPNYWPSDDFHTANPGDYFLFMGRMIHRKGVQIAADVCEHLGARLILAGENMGAVPGYGDYIGPVGPAARAELMAGAIATFVPTLYVEPFGGVAAEALMSGCPVITTDWGAFSEYVEPLDGWRCHTMAEFVDAARTAEAQSHFQSYGVDARRERRGRAIARFSYDAIAPQYERYYEQLMGLWGEGFTAMEHEHTER